MPETPGGGTSSLIASYREQDAKYGRRVFRRWQLAIACSLLFLGGVFGWALLPIPALLAAFPADFFPYSSFVVVVLAFLAAYREEPGIVAVGAVVGLLTQFPSVGTLLSGAALVALWKVESTGPGAANV